MSYFEVKIKVDRVQEDGNDKKVTESYLVDALSFAEAEDRVIKEIQDYCHGELEVVSITKTKISELVKDEHAMEDKWYKCKTTFTTLDEKTQKEKKSSVLYLINSKDLGTAKAKFVEFMKDSCSDYELVKIEETPILEVYEHE